MAVIDRDDPAYAAVEAGLAEAAATEVPPVDVCLRLARAYLRLGEAASARRWALAVVDGGDDFVAWQGAASVMDRCRDAGPEPRRRARVALLGSYTTTQLGVALRLATARLGIEVDLYESPYGQYRQEVLDPTSGLYAFAPDIVVLAVHEGDIGLAWSSPEPEAAVEEELGRWTSLWEVLAGRCDARVVQFGFALPDLAPLGHLSARLPGARGTAVQTLNLRLGEAAGNSVSIVDCERLSSLFGKERWFDPRYWHLSKQAVALGALPLLARHTAAVIGAALGLTRKCLVLDLDNTLWGGVIGEDGLGGIRLGGGAEGEAFVAFQEYLLVLKERGVILAVCSKNNEADAKEPFESHPEMRLRLEDLAVFVTSWDPKPEQVRAIAASLDLGLDSLVFVDDNPAEREAMRQLCPEVDVVPLPDEPALFARALSHYLPFESSVLTAEDAHRTEQYRARAEAYALEASATTLDDFLRSLEMTATIAPVAETDLERVVQLLGKTNQFNVTSRRHGRGQVERLVAEPANVHLTLRLRDRFADHGLVGVVLAVGRGPVLDIDTWLMSCRVLGRTAEAATLAWLTREALARGYGKLRGTYVPTAKNGLVADLFARYGFRPVGDDDGTTTWEYDLLALGPVESPHIAIRSLALFPPALSRGEPA